MYSHGKWSWLQLLTRPPIIMAHHLMTDILAYFRVILTLLSDQGWEFTGHVWQELQHLLGCKVYLTSPFHPIGNAVVERVNRTINNVIRTILMEDPHLQWPVVLPTIQLNLNAALHSTHYYTLYHVNFG